MNTGPTDRWLRQIRVIATAAVLACSGGAAWAQSGGVQTSIDDAPPFATSVEGPRFAKIASSAMSLKASEVLAPRRKRAAGRSVSSFGSTTVMRPSGLVAAPRLRLDQDLADSGKGKTGARPVIPQGDLNRTGIVRATAVRFRDGAFFLVGDYVDHEDLGLAASDAVGRN